jgi:hypothetical protein
MKRIFLSLSLLFSFSCYSQETAKYLVLAEAREGYEVGDIISKQKDIPLGWKEKLPTFLIIRVINCSNDLDLTVPLYIMQGDTLQVTIKNHKYKISAERLEYYRSHAINSVYTVEVIEQDDFFSQIINKED